ncbi:MAG: cupin domain-containing protein [Spirochaetaceae bacterium]|nr:cupin domain-containing protein [Spirochaetaceae bacterium]
MDELQKGKDAGMEAGASVNILREVFRQFDRWGFTPPNTDPLVFDFGLNNFMKTGEVEFWIANEVDAGYCGKFLFVFDGQSCPVHHHLKKLETFFILFGTVKMQYEGVERIMKPGDVLKVEREKDHGFTGVGPALLLEVSQPSILDDNYFLNRQKGFPGA